NLLFQPRESLDSFESTINRINNMLVEKLIKVVIKKHEKEGIISDQIQQFIDKQILRLNHNSDNLIEWLSKNQVKPQYNYFLGLLYYYNIYVKESSDKAFELFSKASENNYSIAQVYLAKCYNSGYGTECNQHLAFKWYQK